MVEQMPTDLIGSSTKETPAPQELWRAVAEGQNLTFSPMADRNGVNNIVSALLRQPGRIIYQLHEPRGAKWVGGALGAIAVGCLAAYGVVVGSFSGAEQLWAAPLKIAAGSLLTAMICLPSLYVFVCLGGANEKLRLDALCGLLMAAVALNALLLVSFAPIAWVFSQSTDSIALIATLHLLFWVIGLCFGLKLIKLGASFLGMIDRGYLLLWMAVFVLVSFQMMTALRPIVGRADHFLPSEKQFFLAHWVGLFAEPTR